MKTFVVMFTIFLVLALLVPPACAQVLYRLPLSSNPGVGSWFDHDQRENFLLRHDGATSFSYDNHHGTDFPTWRGRFIYSGATGALYYSKDGCFELGQKDYSEVCGGGYGNHVRIRHSDGHVSIYAHMKRGTVACDCQSVSCGVYIGQVGESGVTTAAHLHFELWSDQWISSRLDFFGGWPNNYTSYWTSYNYPNTTCQ